jgi:hypothetical protein
MRKESGTSSSAASPSFLRATFNSESGRHTEARVRSIESEAVKTHPRIDRRSLMMSRRIAAKIDGDPGARRAHACSEVCARWVEKGNVPANEWTDIMQRPWPEIRSILRDDSEEGRRLRQNDPFCGILTPAERSEIYREAARNEAAMRGNSR